MKNMGLSQYWPKKSKIICENLYESPTLLMARKEILLPSHSYPAELTIPLLSLIPNLTLQLSFFMATQ
jgi:hypothetical protein